MLAKQCYLPLPVFMDENRVRPNNISTPGAVKGERGAIAISDIGCDKSFADDISVPRYCKC